MLFYTYQIDAETGEHVTYKTILQNSVNLAASLQKLGLKKGDIVALSSENRFEFTVASVAVLYCGGVLSTLNITYSPGNYYYIILLCRCLILICSMDNNSFMNGTYT